MMFSNPLNFFSRIVSLRIFLTALLLAVPGFVRAQGFSFTGATEGGIITLPAGASTTNLTITATPLVGTGSTNAAFYLEYQGSIIYTRTSAPPYVQTYNGLTAGKYYLSVVLVAPGSPLNGNLSFDIQSAPLQPANDNWSQAATLTVNVTAAGTNTYATSEPGEPVHAAIGIGKSVWWKWTATSTAVFTATTAGSAFDTVMGVYLGTNLTSLMEIGPSDDIGPNTFSQVTFQATNGFVYYFAVDGASAVAYGDTRLRLMAGSPPTMSVTAPVNGFAFLVGKPGVKTNTQANATITDPSGIARVNYLFSGPGTSYAGLLSSPYQLSLTNLGVGQYILTLVASNNVGLVNVTNAGFSVLPLAAEMVLDGFDQAGGKFNFGVLGLQGTNYDVEISSNLLVWGASKHFTNFAGAEIITNAIGSGRSNQFYRAVLK